MLERYVSPWTERLTEAGYTVGQTALVFMSFVAGGCAYIILAKLAGVGPFWVTFVPVGTMLAYALLICLARSLRLRDDQSGDNLYYMGFLFTLTSLGVSLYQFTTDHAAEEIVQNFGIAIASTIAGISLRVVLNQMRRDPIEVERMMRLELAEAARRVRRELDSTVVEFGYHRRCAQQAAADSFSHVTERFDEVVSKFLASLEDITAKLAAPLEAASRRSASAIGDATLVVGARLGESAAQLSAASEILSRRADAIAAALEKVTAMLRAVPNPESVLDLHLASTRSPAQPVERSGSQTTCQAPIAKSTLEMVNPAAEGFDPLTIQQQDFNAPAATSRPTLDSATSTIKTMAKVLEQFRTSSKMHMEVLELMLDSTDAAMRTSADVLMKSGIEAATRKDGLREVLPAIEAGAETLAAASKRICEVLEDLRSTRRAAKPETID